MYLSLDHNARARIRNDSPVRNGVVTGPRDSSSLYDDMVLEPSSIPLNLEDLFQNEIHDSAPSIAVPPPPTPTSAFKSDKAMIEARTPVVVPGWPAPILPTPNGQRVYFHYPSEPWNGPIPVDIDRRTALRYLYVAIKAEIQWQLTMIPKILCLDRSRIQIQNMAEYQRLGYEYWIRRVDGFVERHGKRPQSVTVKDAVAVLNARRTTGGKAAVKKKQDEHRTGAEDSATEFSIFALTSCPSTIHSDLRPIEKTSTPLHVASTSNPTSIMRKPRFSCDDEKKKSNNSLTSPCLFLSSRPPPLQYAAELFCCPSKGHEIPKKSCPGTLMISDPRLTWETHFRKLITTVHRHYLDNETNYNRVITSPDEDLQSYAHHEGVGTSVLKLLRRWTREREAQRILLQISWKQGNIEGRDARLDVTESKAVNGVFNTVSSRTKEGGYDDEEMGKIDSDCLIKRDLSRTVEENLKTLPSCQFIDPIRVMSFTAQDLT